MYLPSESAARARSSLAVHAPCPPLPCHLNSRISLTELPSPDSSCSVLMEVILIYIFMARSWSSLGCRWLISVSSAGLCAENHKPYGENGIVRCWSHGARLFGWKSCSQTVACVTKRVLAAGALDHSGYRYSCREEFPSWADSVSYRCSARVCAGFLLLQETHNPVSLGACLPCGC